MAADDFLNTPEDQGFPAELDSSASMSGNRPASGARRATPGEVLSQGFQGAENAGDFLGLDVEFTASQDPNQAYPGGAPLDLVPPPSTYSEEQYAQATAREPAPMPAGDAVQEFAQAPSAFEFGDDLGSEEAFALESQGARGRAKPLLVGTLLAAALAAGGVIYGPSLYTRFSGAETEVANDARPPGWQEKPTRPGPSTTPAKPEPTPVARLDGGASASAQSSAVEPSVPAASVPPSPKPRIDPAPVAAVEPEPVAGGQGELSAGLASLLTPSGASSAARPQPIAFPDLEGGEYAWASEDQLELIWRGSEVPLEALSAPAKTLMPRVGNVRIFTLAGDVFEGRLYAVGQNRVWIDAQPGRVGLDGSKVERIELLPPAPDGQAVAGDQELAGGKRVRVRVPGGMLYGRVLKADGEDVTLALDEGGRVRVKAGDVQELGTGRAVVVGR